MEAYEIAEVPPNNVVTNKDVERLTQHKWLNDTCINAITHLIALDFPRQAESKVPLYHVMNTAFFTLLIGPDGEKKYQHESVKGFTKIKNVRYSPFECRKIFVPVNIGNFHWTLMTIELFPPNAVHIYTYDSLNLFRQPHENVVAWILDELRLLPAWALVHIDIRVFRTEVLLPQVNEYDCGVYVCAAIAAIAAGKTPEFRPEYIRAARQKFASDIVNYRGDSVHRLKKLINW